MNCQWVKDSLSAYIDGELSEDQALSVKNHIKECQLCNYEYRRLLNAWKALDLWEELEPPVHLESNILKTIKREKSVRWLKIALPAAAVFLIAIGIFLFYGNEGHKKDMMARTEEPSVQVTNAMKHVDEEEIITNLQLFQEKEFYDTLDLLKKIDYLPLVEEVQEKKNNDKSSSLDFITT